MLIKKGGLKIMKKSYMGIAIICLGILSGIIFFSAGNHLQHTGDDMKTLMSESGTSLAEVYYQDVGKIAIGLGKMCYTLGLGIITTSCGIGGKYVIHLKKELNTKDNDEDRKVCKEIKEHNSVE